MKIENQIKKMVKLIQQLKTTKLLFLIIIVIIIFIIIFYIFSLSQQQKREGMTNTPHPSPPPLNSIPPNNKWTKESTDKFIRLQYLINPKIIFDPNQIQKQASQEELDYFLKTGHWYWSPETESKYKEAVKHNTFILTDPNDSMNDAKTVYSDGIIRNILFQQTNEGQFLIHGVMSPESNNAKLAREQGVGDFATASGIIGNQNPVFKCLSKDPNNLNSPLILKKTTTTGVDGIFGFHTKESVPVKEPEKEIPGFHFLGSKCNPCQALNDPPDYSCQFKIDLRK